MNSLILGCNKPASEPELVDPIYRDLLTEYSNAQKAVLDNQKKVEEAKANLKTIVPQTGQNRKITAAYHDAKERLAMSEQMEEYYKVKSKLRKFEARNMYLKAFEEGKEWPDPIEYSNYLRDKETKTRSRNWRDRTPSYDALKAFEDKKKKALSDKSSSH